jgi:hypothetical protein
VVPLGLDRVESIHDCERFEAGEDYGEIDDECMSDVLSEYLRFNDGVCIPT